MLPGLCGVGIYQAGSNGALTAANTTPSGRGKGRCLLQQRSGRPSCPRCWRPVEVCLCRAVPAGKFPNCHARLVVLQHPKCQVSTGTARILKLAFKHCDVLVGECVLL